MREIERTFLLQSGAMQVNISAKCSFTTKNEIQDLKDLANQLKILERDTEPKEKGLKPSLQTSHTLEEKNIIIRPDSTVDSLKEFFFRLSNVFDNAQSEILSLMEKDTFIRFKNSKFFEKFQRGDTISEADLMMIDQKNAFDSGLLSSYRQNKNGNNRVSIAPMK